MNLEGITLKILTEELKQSLEGGKIYKIFAPSKDSLLLLINKDNATVYFLADFTGGSPLVYLPENLPERPDNPSPFCMLLRKHLEEGIYQVSAVSASDVLKRNTDSLRCAVENDVFASLPQDSLLDELEMGWEDEQ